MIHPIALGSGKHLFGEGTISLRLEDNKTTSMGVVILTYRPAAG